MKNFDTLLGILFILAVVIGCHVVGEILGEGMIAGLFFFAMAILVITSLYRQVTKSKD